MQKQREIKQKLADLTDVAESAIRSVARMFECSDEEYAALPRLKRKPLVPGPIARATLVRDQLRAQQPSCAAYPLIRFALEGGHPRERVGYRYYSGSDGIGALTRIPVVTFLPNRIAFHNTFWKEIVRKVAHS